MVDNFKPTYLDDECEKDKENGRHGSLAPSPPASLISPGQSPREVDAGGGGTMGEVVHLESNGFVGNGAAGTAGDGNKVRRGYIFLWGGGVFYPHASFFFF